ncbi:hypothetical protein PLANPX_1736 [Lacipirellula parvula]|uniref:Uncharacterized protein n=1 Tax=Lacipirellula parvula TaxID=2650471 RepID=A0A5K7X5V5_9BACT|nr:hypothetical protein PLANPX_1736 [Lacipirellula parvula]
MGKVFLGLTLDLAESKIAAAKSRWPKVVRSSILVAVETTVLG